MRAFFRLGVVVGIFSFGCGTTGGGVGPVSAPPNTTIDGLVRVDTETPGSLYLREDHGIGGYDAVAMAPAFVNYRRSSRELDPDLENVYRVSLEQALFDAAIDAGAPIVDTVGKCVLKIGIGFVNVDLARSTSAEVLGEMTLVIEYRDSKSNESLLRYIEQERILKEPAGKDRRQQVRDSFDRMITEVDIIKALRSATLKPSPPRPGCKGLLIRAGMPEE